MIRQDDERVKHCLTPWRYSRPVLSGSGIPGHFDERSVDIPFVFKHGGRYYMVYTGFDGIGYQSALAVSDDLLHWEFYSMILQRNDLGHWDSGGGAVTWMILKSSSLWETPELRKIDGKYWMVYHAYPGTGYEEGPAQIGLAYCEDEDLKNWHFQDSPVFSWKDGKDWENGGLYKACVIRHEGLWYMFYNAKNKAEHWIEQTGAAFSRDLIHWERAEENPVLRVDPAAWDCVFVSDPFVARDKDHWKCFYYGIGKMDPADGLYHAEEGLALSQDLLHWEKVEGPILKHGPAGSFDDHHAHKPALFYEDGILYHFYCATCQASPDHPTELFDEYRTICVAASRGPEAAAFPEERGSCI